MALEEETVRSHHVEMEFEIDDDNAADSDEEAFAIEIKTEMTTVSTVTKATRRK